MSEAAARAKAQAKRDRKANLRSWRKYPLTGWELDRALQDYYGGTWAARDTGRQR